MSIVHIFVCDFCGNQLQLETSHRFSNSEPVPSIAVNALSGPQAYEEKQEYKNEEPTAFYSVSIDWSSETKYYHGDRLKKSDSQHFSFCDKDCFVEYLQKFMTDKGHFNKSPNAQYVEGK